MSFESMLRGLNDARIDYVVIGGVAGAAHGSPFLTNDLDVCYRDSRENVQLLATLLARWHAYPRGWEPGLPFDMDVKTFASTPVLTLQTREGQLDLLDEVAGVGKYDAVLASSEEVSALGTSFRVLSLRALIAAKRATGRTKDLAQLPTLEALQALQEERTDVE
jgi:predicted nucleotidyltransferase